MPKIQYRDLNLSAGKLATIEKANAIIAEYREQGYDLTLRQLYYQFVARDLIANKQTEYKRLGAVVNDGRLAGLIDWYAIVDRTRNVRALPHWESPAHIVQSVAEQFRIDRWEDQPHRVEVWIEKDALVGVIEGVCDELDVPYFSCRGYTSQSEMWSAAQRLRGYQAGRQTPVILHFGDHDPSGIDMTRDIADRLGLFTGGAVEVNRLALNMDQVEEHSPPPNPAKTTDSRFNTYVVAYGDDSWELDALEPAVLSELIRSEIEALIDDEKWAQSAHEIDDGRDRLAAISNRFNEVSEWLDGEEQ